MLYYLLTVQKETGKLIENGVVLKSIVRVSCQQLSQNTFGMKIVDVLTGFKFIAEKIKQYEADKSQNLPIRF